MQIKLFIFITFFVISYFSFSQENTINKTTDTLSLSLPEALALGEQNVIVLKNANLDLEIARKKIWESAASALPQIEANANYQGILGVLPQANFGEFTVPLMRAHQILGKIQASMFINGSYIVGLHASRTYKQLSEQQIEKTRLQLKADISEAYSVMLLAGESLEIVRKNMENMEKLSSDMDKNAEAGMIDAVDADQIRLTTNNLRNIVRSMERQYTLSQDMLKFNMGIPLGTPIKLTDSLKTIAERIPSNITLIDSLDVNRNIDYKLSITQVQLQKSQYNLTLMDYLPTLSAFYSFQDYLAGSPEFNLQPRNTVGATLKIPIFSSGLRYSKVKQAKFEVEKAKNNQDLLEDNLKLQFANSINNYSTAYENYLLQIENKSLAEKVYNNISLKFMVGMASSSDLMQANDKFLEAISNYIEQQSTLIKARIELDKLLNNL